MVRAGAVIAAALAVCAVGPARADKLGRDNRTDDEIWDLIDAPLPINDVGVLLPAAGAAVGAVQARPWCDVTCSAVVNRSVIRPPLVGGAPPPARWRGRRYDWGCWAAHFTYKLPPGCRERLGVGSLGPEHLDWSLTDALPPTRGGAPKCRVRDWSPAEAAAEWQQRRRQLEVQSRPPTDMTTVMLFGTSLLRGTFEALVCRWNDEITGGFTWHGDIEPLDEIRRGNGTCHGLTQETIPKWYPKDTHDGRAFPVQHLRSCDINYACVEFGRALRVCYSFYGLGSVPQLHKWALCASGHHIDEIDVLVAEQGDAAFERDRQRLLEPSDCQRSAPSFTTLRLGRSVGLRPVLDAAALSTMHRFAPDKRYVQHLCTTLGGDLCPPVAATPVTEALYIKSVRPDCSGRPDHHDRLPGAPDHYAKMLLNLFVHTADLQPGQVEHCRLVD